MKKDMIDSLLLAITVALFFVYFLTSIPRSHMYELTIALDYFVPLLSFFVIPYCSFQIFLIPVTIYALYQHESKSLLRIFLVSAVLILATSNIIFLVFPTYFPHRPEIIGNSIFSRMIQFVYKMDYPCALCPSVHVNISILCAILWSELQSKFSKIMIFWAVLVALSTLFIRQHYIIDVFAGIASAYICYFIGKKITYNYLLDKEYF